MSIWRLKKGITGIRTSKLCKLFTVGYLCPAIVSWAEKGGSVNCWTEPAKCWMPNLRRSWEGFMRVGLFLIEPNRSKKFYERGEITFTSPVPFPAAVGKYRVCVCGVLLEIGWIINNFVFLSFHSVLPLTFYSKSRRVLMTLPVRMQLVSGKGFWRWPKLSLSYRAILLKSIKSFAYLKVRESFSFCHIIAVAGCWLSQYACREPELGPVRGDVSKSFLHLHSPKTLFQEYCQRSQASPSRSMANSIIIFP